MLSGWRAVALENDLLRVVILPEKGRHRRAHGQESGVDPLFKAPWGLRPPGSVPREGWEGHEFLANYEGGWQELFPNANDPADYRGETIPFHGEVATLPWDCREEGAVLRLTVRCRQTPFRLERLMRLEGRQLVLEERVTNESEEPAHFVWGHHCVVGPPFLEAGCRLRVPAGTLETIPELWEETARLAPGRRSAWPHARLRDGETVDLSLVPGPEARSHDDVYLTDLAAGSAAVLNPRLGLEFRLDWDPRVFRWVISWQPYGGAEAMPLRGSYALGIEPWVSRLDLEHAVAKGEAIELSGGETFETIIRAGMSGVRSG